MKIKFELIQEAIENDSDAGFCLECGEEAGGCEPDAEHYLCEGCGANEVFGAEQILMMGEVDDVDDNE